MKIPISMSEACMNFYRKTSDICKKNINSIVLFALCWLVMSFDFLCWYSDISRVNLGGYYYVITQSFGYGLIIFSLCFVGINALKWLVFILITISLTVSVILFFCQRTFAMLLDGDIVLIIMMSSIQECKEFIGIHFNFNVFLILICFFLVLIGFAVVFYLHKLPFDKRKLVLSFFIIIVVFGFQHRFNINSFFTRSSVGYFVVDTFSRVQDYIELGKMAKSPSLPSNIADLFDESKDSKKCIGVIVIGESVSRNYLSLYGFSRETSPRLDSRRESLYVFDNCQTITNGTGEALRYLVTQKLFKEASKELCSFVDVYKAAGWKVVYFSTPPRWGQWETVEGALFANADKLIYLSEIMQDKKANDHDLLPYFEKELVEFKKTNSPTLFIFHLDGSHMPANNKYPKSFGPFSNCVDKENEELPEPVKTRFNEYTNSLAWTDIFLGKILDELEKLNLPSFFVYVSDHGESIKSSSYRRMDVKDTFEIPLVVWFSHEYKELFSERLGYVNNNLSAPIEIDRLFWNFLYMGTISYDNFPYKHCLFSEQFEKKHFAFPK